MGKKYIYIVLFISTGIYAIADYYCESVKYFV